MVIRLAVTKLLTSTSSPRKVHTLRNRPRPIYNTTSTNIESTNPSDGCERDFLHQHGICDARKLFKLRLIKSRSQVNRQIRDPAIGDSLSVHPHSHLLPDPGRRRQCDQGKQRTAQCVAEVLISLLVCILTPYIHISPVRAALIKMLFSKD